jgi:hypothetical protein
MWRKKLRYLLRCLSSVALEVKPAFFTGEAMLQVRWGLYVRRVMSTCQIVVGFSIDNILAEPYTST